MRFFGKPEPKPREFGRVIRKTLVNVCLSQRHDWKREQVEEWLTRWETNQRPESKSEREFHRFAAMAYKTLFEKDGVLPF